MALVGALIKDVGVESEVANRIQVVPAGHYILPARDHWLSPFWFAALYAMHPRAQPAMMKLKTPLRSSGDPLTGHVSVM